MVPSPKRLEVSVKEQEASVLMLQKDWDGDLLDKGVGGGLKELGCRYHRYMCGGGNK